MNLVQNAIGIDEVGRGSLAGPVVAAAVVFHHSITQEMLYDIGVKDSKAVSEKRRKIIYDKLMNLLNDELLWCGIGRVEAHEIDEYGIVPSTNKAMMLALQQIPSFESKKILVDGILNPFLKLFDVAMIVKGDAKCYNIAAASIIAKVFRDDLMSKFFIVENQCYNWNKNKGYSSLEHMNAIRENGFSSQHRRTFCKKLMME